MITQINPNQKFVIGAVATQLLTSHLVNKVFGLFNTRPTPLQFYGVHALADTIGLPLLWWHGADRYLEGTEQEQAKEWSYRLTFGSLTYWASFGAMSLLGLRGELRSYGTQICRIGAIYMAPALLQRQVTRQNFTTSSDPTVAKMRYGAILLAQLFSTVAIGKATMWALRGSSPLIVWGAVALESILITPLLWIGVSRFLPGKLKGETERMGKNMSVASGLGFIAWGGTELLGMRGFPQRLMISVATILGLNWGHEFLDQLGP